MKTIHAVFEDGVFRPTEPVELPEHAEVEFEPRLIDGQRPKTDGEMPKTDGLRKIYEILLRSYDSGDSGLASRHNEHQP